MAQARDQRGPAEAVTVYREALSLWRGPALAGVCPSPPLQAAVQALEELRLASVEQLAAGYAQLGEYARAAAVLRAEAVAHPLRESLSAALVTALHRAGRRSEAVDWFHRTRRPLADELGIGPGRELADAYAMALRGEADDAATEAAAPSRAATVDAAPLPPVTLTTFHSGAPDLLPRAPRGFHGRAAELAALSRAAAGEGPVCLFTGPAGVGKTALVLQWAHDGRAGFPDGRLYADMRGFGDTGEPGLIEVLREFLLALGDPDEAAEVCERAVELARKAGDRTIERLALQHLARHQVDAGQWRPALDTATKALALDDRPGTADVPRILLLMARGEALLGLGDEAEGIWQLDLAARGGGVLRLRGRRGTGTRFAAAGIGGRGVPGTVRHGAGAAHGPSVTARRRGRWDAAVARLTTRTRAVGP
ncbi:BTAD domain-containing putative transcriptional regulator [Streptomyces sp. NPDC053079]|uniref:BTAD domain-containing putative transcriptional regulator n=1 Tax=Streptomyces sp. NPDC053079 TaxID=3365697 RepID=UPI0037D35486